MKILPGIVKYVVLAIGTAVSVIVLSCAQHNVHSTGADSGKVTIDEKHIRIPGVKISQKDQQDINAILKHYDKSLYKIGVYDNGKLTKTKGAMTDVEIGQEMVSSIAKNAEKNGFSNWTFACDGTVVTNKDNVGGQSWNSEEMLKRLRPIFEKYSE